MMLDERRLRLLGPAMASAFLLSVPGVSLAATNLTAERVEKAIVVVDDPLEVETVISTERVFRSTRGLIPTLHNDNHLRAFVHKDTGHLRFEVRQGLNYVGPFRDYDKVTYETAGRPRTGSLRLIESNKDHCRGADANAACYEAVSFEVSEPDLRAAATNPVGRSAGGWGFKLKPDLGQEHRAEIPRAEIVGLLRVVDGHRATRVHPSTSASVAPAPALNP